MNAPAEQMDDIWKEGLLINPLNPVVQSRDAGGRVLDPSSRFIRCEKLKENLRTSIFKAQDHEEGTEVLWYEINLDNATHAQIQRICTEIKILGHINEPHIINLHRAWIDKTRNLLVLITELFSEKTIRSYVTQEFPNPSKTVIGNWCISILEGLEHLHNLEPPIIHNDVVCDNIFIDSDNGVLKLGLLNINDYFGDFITPLSAPEVQEGTIDPKCDVWELGLAVIEMATGKRPYSEYQNPADVKKAIKDHIMPQAFSDLSDPMVADFVVTCLNTFEKRPSSTQLMEHSLITECLPDGDSSARSDMPERHSTKEISDDLAAVLELDSKVTNLKNSPEFVQLLKTQITEKHSLLEIHKQQREALRNKIRERLLLQKKY